MKKILALGVLLALTTGEARAQRVILLPGGCGTGLPSGGDSGLYVDSGGNLCIAGGSSGGSVTPGTTPTKVQSVQGGGTGALPVTTTNASAVHTQMPDVTIAAGASAVVLTVGQIATGCDVTFTGTTPSYRIAYTTVAAPGTVTATATNGLAPAGAPYHCPVPAPTQGLSVYNSGTNALTVSVDRY